MTEMYGSGDVCRRIREAVWLMVNIRDGLHEMSSSEHVQLLGNE